MNQKALSTLEYTKIIAKLEEYSSTSIGKKRFRELVEQHCSPRLSDRLVYRPDPLEAHFLGGIQRCRYLSRVVRVVVDDGNAVYLR